MFLFSPGKSRLGRSFSALPIFKRKSRKRLLAFSKNARIPLHCGGISIK
jgi:hypothetical protein